MCVVTCGQRHFYVYIRAVMSFNGLYVYKREMVTNGNIDVRAGCDESFAYIFRKIVALI